MENRNAEHRGLGDLPERDRADRGDRHQGADPDPAVPQIPQRTGHERRPPRRRPRSSTATPPVGSGCADEPSGAEQDRGRGGHCSSRTCHHRCGPWSGSPGVGVLGVGAGPQQASDMLVLRGVVFGSIGFGVGGAVADDGVDEGVPA